MACLFKQASKPKYTSCSTGQSEMAQVALALGPRCRKSFDRYGIGVRKDVEPRDWDSLMEVFLCYVCTWYLTITTGSE